MPDQHMLGGRIKRGYMSLPWGVRSARRAAEACCPDHPWTRDITETKTNPQRREEDTDIGTVERRRGAVRQGWLQRQWPTCAYLHPLYLYWFTCIYICIYVCFVYRTSGASGSPLSTPLNMSSTNTSSPSRTWHFKDSKIQMIKDRDFRPGSKMPFPRRRERTSNAISRSRLGRGVHEKFEYGWGGWNPKFWSQSRKLRLGWLGSWMDVTRVAYTHLHLLQRLMLRRSLRYVQDKSCHMHHQTSFLYTTNTAIHSSTTCVYIINKEHPKETPVPVPIGRCWGGACGCRPVAAPRTHAPTAATAPPPTAGAPVCVFVCVFVVFCWKCQVFEFRTAQHTNTTQHNKVHRLVRDHGN